MEQRQQAMLQLHLSDRRFYYLLRCVLYGKFNGNFQTPIKRKYLDHFLVNCPHLCHNASLTYGQSILVQVMVWWHQAASYCLNQCWPRYLTPYDDTMPQRVSIPLRSSLYGTQRFEVQLAHDDVIKGKHFPRYWAFVRGFHRSPLSFPHKCQWRRALIFSFSVSE